MAESRAPREDLVRRALLPAIVLLSAIGYTWTAPRWILGGDNGEFATLYATGGIAHPSGYPATVLWLRLWHWLPVATPAHGAALATVVLGALGVVALQRACLAWGASSGATAFASAVYAFSPLVWKMACHAEVMAMNAFFAAVILALSAPTRPWPWPRGGALTFALGLVAGLGLSNHTSIVLMAPIGLLGAARAVGESKRPYAAVLAGVVGLVVGLLPYSYVYVVARTGDPQAMPMWIEAPTWAGVFYHFRRGAYGTFSLSTTAEGAGPLVFLWLFAKTSTRQLLGLPIVVLLAALLGWKRRAGVERSRRVALVALGSTFLLAGPLFIARFNIPLVGAGPMVAERFYLLPEVLLTVMAALSLDTLVPGIVARRGLMAALTLEAAIVASVFTIPVVLEHNRPTVELYVENTLRGAPKDAIIVGTGDHRWGGFMYARYVEKLRLDVVYVNEGTLIQAWYRRELEPRLGVSLDTPAGRSVGPRTLMARLLATGRPVLYTDWPEPSVETTPHVSEGTLMRVLREGESEPSPGDVLARNLEVEARYEMEGSPPKDEHSWGFALQPDYARPWVELARRYGQAGDAGSEQACLARAEELAPWLVKVR